jgi:hypothetical protein
MEADVEPTAGLSVRMSSDYDGECLVCLANIVLTKVICLSRCLEMRLISKFCEAKTTLSGVWR